MRKVKIFLLRRWYVMGGAALLAAAAIFYVVNYPASVSAAAAARQLPIYSVERSQKVCSISFDAAWGNEDTQTLIDILAQYDVKTTFFVVGDWAEKYPESVKALHDAGHEVMSHSNHHDHYNSLSTQQIIDDVTASNQRISAATGVTPTLIRCPYGEYDDHVIAAIRSMGMEPIQWDVDSLDWKDYDAETICKRVTSTVHRHIEKPSGAAGGLLFVLWRLLYAFMAGNTWKSPWTSCMASPYCLKYSRIRSDISVPISRTIGQPT